MGVFVPCSRLTAVPPDCCRPLNSLLHSLSLYFGCWLGLTPFPLPHLYRFLLELDIKTQSHWDLPRTDLGKRALNFPFNCFGSGLFEKVKILLPSVNDKKLLSNVGIQKAWM